MLRKCIVLAVILVMIFSLSACDLIPTKTPPTPTATEELEGIKITAYELSEEYEANEIAADHKYKDHTLIIVGKITDISRDPDMNKAYVSVGGGEYSGEQVRCFFNNEDELLGLAELEEVIIKGECVGKKKDKEGTSFPILFSKCSLIEETEFQVTGWQIVKSEYYNSWSLEINFTKFGYSLVFCLINPEGMESILSTAYSGQVQQGLGFSSTKGKIRFPLRGTPPPGQYKLVVKTREKNIVATEIFNFSGASPRVEVVDYDVLVSHDEHSIQEWALEHPGCPVTYAWLHKIDLRIKNAGDLPLCLEEIKFVCDTATKPGYYSAAGRTIGDSLGIDIDLGPGEEGTFESETCYTESGLWFPSSGQHTVVLRFVEFGKVVYSTDTTITVPEKPPVE